MTRALSLREAVHMLVVHELEQIRRGAPVGDPRERADNVTSVFDHVPNDGMIERGARAFAEGFSNPNHPCRTTPCGECLDDAQRVLAAALGQDEEGTTDAR